MASEDHRDASGHAQAVAGLIAAGPAVVERALPLLSEQDPFRAADGIEILSAVGAPAAEPVAALLGTGSQQLDSNVAETLGNIGNPAVTALIPLMQQIGTHRYLNAISVFSGNIQLARCGGPAVGVLMHCLKSSSEYERAAATRSLAEIGLATGHFPTETMREILDNDPSGSVRQQASMALHMHEERSARTSDDLGVIANAATGADGSHNSTTALTEQRIAALESAETNGDAAGRLAAIAGLRQLGATALPQLLQLIMSNDPVRQADGVELLSFAGAPAVKPVIAIFGVVAHDTDDCCTEVLGKIGTPSIGPLVDAIGGNDPRRAMIAMYAFAHDPRLARLGEPAFPSLLDAMKNKQTTIRVFATQAVAEIGIRTGNVQKDALISALSDPSQIVQMYAKHGLGIHVDGAPDAAFGGATADQNSDGTAVGPQIEPARAVEQLLTAVSRRDDIARASAIASLRRSGAAALPQLLDLFVNTDQGIQNDAADLLVAVGGPAAQPVFDLAVKSPQPVDERAYKVLGRIVILAIEPLKTALAQTDIQGRKIATCAIVMDVRLARVGESVLPLLIDVMKRGSDDERLRATMAVAAIGKATGNYATEALKAATQDPSPGVVFFAKQALEQHPETGPGRGGNGTIPPR